MTADPTTAPSAEDVATHQPVLPTLELPEYHGKEPVGMRTTVSGTGNRLTSPHGLDDRTILVLEVVCTESGHKKIDKELYYAEKHSVADMFELDRDAGTRLLRFLRSTYRTEADAARGVSALPDLGDVGYTDSSGVVLTAAEVAELRGETILRVVTDTELTPVVALYDDGSRLLWPDEYEPGRDRPRIDETNEDGARVVELIHHATGEPVDDDGAPLPEADADDPDPFPADDEWNAAVRASLTGTTIPDEPVILADEHVDRDAPTVFDPTRGIHVDADQTTTTPDSPAPDYDDGGWSDGPAYDAPTDPATAPAPLLPGEAELADTAPDAFAFGFVDCQIPDLRTKLGDVADRILLRRILEAEKQGRGRGLTARRGALDAIYARIAEVGS